MDDVGFSEKQLRAMFWWREEDGYDAIICDGAVRSGKTLSMGIGFFLWAMSRFDGCRFGLCGRTKNSLRRNVLEEILPHLTGTPSAVQECRVITDRKGADKTC